MVLVSAVVVAAAAAAAAAVAAAAVAVAAAAYSMHLSCDFFYSYLCTFCIGAYF